MRYLFILLVLFPLTLLAQPAGTWDAIVQRIDAKPFAGKRFKVQAAVKVEQIDPTAAAAIWVRVDKAGNKMGFFNNMMDRPITANQWQVYTIEGKLDNDADFLNIGGLYFKKGRFYFDDFKLFIETSKNNFEEHQLDNGNFENENLGTWFYNRQSKFYLPAVTNIDAFEGKGALAVDGSNALKPLTYGNNDSTGKFAIVNGIKIYYEEYGSGEPLLLLHGNSQSIAAFTHQIPELAKHFQVICVDTRGQGKSTEDGKQYTYDLFAADMHAFLNVLGLDSVNIVGWSDGGNTGLIMAMKYPAKVKRLVTMGANIFINETVVEKGVIPTVTKQIKVLEKDTTYKSQNSARLMTMLLKEPNYRFGDLKQINCPVLVLAGAKDMIRAEHTKGLAANIPKATLHIEPKATHYFPSENPARFNAVVLDFLQTRF
ncbi:alpha/beta fold hydrolase [Paracnuella aquatica]|uniref:alpha/beta fold hydrolase n=1 Tax=Paracnuella aquatica TaxID=2268757 RepID=UPI000DEF8070|nr:alpha/beta hydrolase [Paracnuella aquatica]RPD43810.1 alpha/beta hydrolase [Paracnuella aquatica]